MEGAALDKLNEDTGCLATAIIIPALDFAAEKDQIMTNS